MNVVDSIRRQITPIHPEGYVFIAAFAVGALVLSWIWSPLGWIGLVLTLWCAYFFRDPVRVTPVDETRPPRTPARPQPFSGPAQRTAT